jgi:prolyl 4-hydroxylase
MEKDERPPPSRAEIVHYLAVKTAEGRDVAQDWDKALGLLYRSAELGSSLAQAELAGLAGQWTLAHEILGGEAVPDGQWQSLRSSIELAKWLAPAPKPEFSDGLRIAVAEDFAAPELCDWMIARARPRLKPAKITDRETGQSSISDLRSGSACLFRRPDGDLILAILRARIAAITETQVAGMEIPTVLHYSEGEEFTPHFDITIDPDAPDYGERLARGDQQRVITFLLYLNDDYEGGETEFPALGRRWKGRKGEGLFFWNVHPDGTLDQRTLHAGLPVTQGEKWLLSQWILGQPR